FLIAGLSLWMLSPAPPPGGQQVVGRALAVGVIGLATLGLTGYLFGWQHGPDQWLFHDQVLRDAERLGYANRMAPNTAAAFVAVGLALLLLDVRGRRGIWVAHGLALAANLLGLLTLLGYAYSALALTGVEH